MEELKKKNKFIVPNTNLIKKFIDVNQAVQAAQTSAPPSECKSARSSKYKYIEEKQSMVDEKYFMDHKSISEPPAPELAPPIPDTRPPNV